MDINKRDIICNEVPKLAKKYLMQIKEIIENSNIDKSKIQECDDGARIMIKHIDDETVDNIYKYISNLLNI